jgi:tape measure domain-containing protein
VAESNVGDITARLRVDTSDWQRSLNEAARQVQDFGQKTQQTQQQLSQLPFNAIQNATDQFSRAIQNAGNSQDRMRQAIAQAQQQLTQFNVTVDASGRMTDRFGDTLSRGAADALRQFQVGIREAQAELAQFQRFGIGAAQVAGGGGGLLQQMLGVAGGLGIVTTIQGITRALSDFVQASVTLAASMENLHRSFTAIQGSSAAANQTLTALFNTAQRAGISFTDAAEGFRRLQAGAASTVLTTQDLQVGFDNIARGATVMGLSTAQVSQAIVAFEQMLTKGRLSAEELVKQLGNAVPGGLARTAQGLGVTTERLRQMAEAGVIPSTIAFTAFQTEMGKMADAIGPIDGLTASFNRLKNEMAAWMTAIGGWIGDQILPLVKGITELSAALRDLFGIQAPGVTTPASPGGPGTRMRFAPEGAAFNQMIQQQAGAVGIDPGLLSHLVRVESGFNPQARSKAGALGLGQLMPGTAEMLQPGISEAQILEPETNIRLAAQYLARMLKATKDFEGSTALALASYNAGPKRVADLLEAAGRAGQPQSYASIAPRLPAETQTYVQKILGPQAGAPAPPASVDATTTAVQQNVALTENWRKELDASLKQFQEIKRQVDALATSGMNFNGILSQGINQQATRLVERLSTISNFFAAFPDEAAKMSGELRDQATAAFQQAAIWKESLLTETQRRDLGRQQVETLEQVISRQKTMLISQREGQEAAERFSRLDTARLQAARIDDRAARAGMTLTQQIDRDAQRLQALQNEAAQLSSELEARRVEAMRPQLESQLQRIQSFLGRPEQSVAEQARQQVLTQGAAAQAELVKLIQETSRHPALQDLQEAFQNAFQALPGAVEQNAAKAFAAVERQGRDALRGLTDQFDQITMQLGAAGLDPLTADLARIDRSFAGLLDKVQALDAALEKLGIGATAEQQVGITALRERLALITEARIEEGRLAAERERRDRDLLGMREQVERTREGLVNPEQRESTRMRQRLERGGFTQEGQREVEGLIAQQEALERVMVAVEIWRDLSSGVGSAWVNALTSIADGTQSVSQAFEAMGKSIMKTMADIAAQQAFQAIFRLGVGLLMGGLMPAPTVGGGGAAMGGAGGGGFLASLVGGTSTVGTGAGTGIGAGMYGFQHGGVINSPTRAILGENASNNPEIVLNRYQTQAMMAGAGAGQAVNIHNYPSKAEAEAGAARDRASGHRAIVNEVLTDLSAGSGSKIGRAMRLLQT